MRTDWLQKKTQKNTADGSMAARQRWHQAKTRDDKNELGGAIDGVWSFYKCMYNNDCMHSSSLDLEHHKSAMLALRSFVFLCYFFPMTIYTTAQCCDLCDFVWKFKYLVDKKNVYKIKSTFYWKKMEKKSMPFWSQKYNWKKITE